MENIEDYAFSGLGNLKHIYIPSSVTVVGSEYEISKDENFEPHAIVAHCVKDKESYINEELGNAGFIIVPDYEQQKEKDFTGYDKGEEYVVIDDTLYQYNGSDENVDIPSGYFLCNIYIPDSVTELEIDSFFESENLIVHCKEGSMADGAFTGADYVYDYE